jgi:RimJ/RimL family protein N-acetyltransferase
VSSLNQIRRQYQLANLGYWVHSAHKGKGLATRLAGAVARFGLRQLQLQRIEIVAEATNGASLSVARKLGATCECLARHRLRHHGEPRDAHVFSLISSDLSA